MTPPKLTIRRSGSAFLCGCLLLTGCRNAPNIDILGSFFPVWMLCLAIAVPLTFGVRAVLVRYKLENEVGPLALFYPCVVLLCTSLLWLIFFQ
jgi:hypothetical protein